MRVASRLIGAGRTTALGVLCTAALAAAAAPAAVAAAQPERGAVPAMWQTYDLIVDLDDLPRTYTCDDLWYEFHGILLRLGVPQQSLFITPYDCSPSGKGALRSPRVEVRFQLPSPVLPALARLAHFKAARRIVRIAPGEPKTLKRTDCRLLEQMRQNLLGSLPVHVLDSHLDCDALAGRGRFGLTVRVMVAETTSAAAPR